MSTSWINNEFHFGALWATCLLLCSFSMIFNGYITVMFLAYKELRSPRNYLNFNIIVSDWLSNALCTFLAALATADKKLGFRGDYYCSMYGCLSLLRNVTWLTLVVLAYARSRQMRNFNPTGELELTYVKQRILAIWIFSILFASFGFMMSVYNENSSCILIRFNSNFIGGLYAFSSSAIIVSALVFIVGINFRTTCTVKLNPRSTLKDNSGMNLYLIVIMLVIFDIPFVAEQFSITVIGRKLFDSKFIFLTSFIASLLSQIWNPVLLWHNNEKFIFVKYRGIIIQDADEPPEQDAEIPMGWMRKIYERLALDIGPKPTVQDANEHDTSDKGAGEENRENLRLDTLRPKTPPVMRTSTLEEIPEIPTDTPSGGDTKNREEPCPVDPTVEIML